MKSSETIEMLLKELKQVRLELLDMTRRRDDLSWMYNELLNKKEDGDNDVYDLDL